MKKKSKRPYGAASNVIFFLNVFIALMIISGAWILIETEFGQSTVVFGFLVLCISVVMKAIRWW
jgi:hypothetical protein